METKSHALLLQEIPIQSASSQRSPQEITVVEGNGAVPDGNINYPESEGGNSFQLGNSTRTICWRTSNSVLELFEYSLDSDLYSCHYIITFEGSKVLPGVHVSITNNQLHIACCTVHGVHYLALNIPSSCLQVPKPGIPSPSLLSNLGNFDFEAEKSNCYFSDQVQDEVSLWNAAIIEGNGKSGLHLSAALLTSQGNLVLVRIDEQQSPVISAINQTSRMSRMWAGINPWADAGGTETIADLKVLELQNAGFIVAVCRDFKLRVWSFDTHDIVFSSNLPAMIQDGQDQSKPAVLKIQVCKETDMVSVYIGLSDCATFLQFKIEIDANTNSASLDQLSSVSASLTVQDALFRYLVHYTLSAENILTVLWRDAEEVDSITICMSDVGIWHDVAAHSLPAPDVPLLPYRDVRESYMDYIFTPSRFSPAALALALAIHQRGGTYRTSNMEIQEMKERLAAHIHNKIEELSPEEDADDESLQENVWRNFYQKLIQYQQVVSRSMGLTIAHGSGLTFVSVIKKGYLSILAPVSSLEAVCRGCDPEILRGTLQPEVCTERNLHDLAQLLESLGSLSGYLGLDFLDLIQQNLSSSGRNVCDVISDFQPEILDAIRESAGEESLGNLLGNIDDVGTAISMLLVCLEPSDVGTDFEIPDSQSWPAGSQGIEVLARCTMRYNENRFQLSVLLYITASLLENRQRLDNVNDNEESELAKRVIKFIQAYKSLVWLSTVQTQNISHATLESTMQTLSVHDSNVSALGHDKVHSSMTGLPQGNRTVLEFFISDEGGKLLQAFLSQNSTVNQRNPLILQNGTLSNAVSFLVYLMWPLGPTLTLPDFLLSNGHYTVLQRYLQKELRDWCDWCPKSRAYMLAHCHLHHGDYGKAVESFIVASSGISVEDYLVTKLLQEDEENLHRAAREIIYFTKVLPIFERLDLPEQVISLAQQAIEITKSHEQNINLPILWSSVFRQNNNLSRHCEALKAIVQNPDPDHRKDCLRTLTVSLCEGKNYKTLVEFEYGDLEDDLVSILEHRARGTDLATTQHNYYDLLYAFHVQRGNFRKAASAMYEQGYRIGREFKPTTPKGNIACLQKQMDCYAACINSLHLVSEDNRWILHPVGIKVNLTQQGQNENSVATKTKVKIHELGDIQKESLLVEMKIKLAEMSTESGQTFLGPLVSAQEMSGFLCHVGLYDDAIKVCSQFDISLTSLFASLGAKCVRLSYADDKGIVDAWEWLQENETIKTQYLGGKSSTAKWTAADAAYRLLEVYLQRHGDAESCGTKYYYSTAKSLLSLSATLPAWFVNAYKNRNCPELLRLLICFDRLGEATSLAVDMINLARTKVGTEFGSNFHTRRAVWLPYMVIEQLLCLLGDLRNQSEFDNMYQILSDSLDDYLDIADTTSLDMVQSSLQSAAMAMQS